MTTYQDRHEEWERTGVCRCRRIDRVPQFTVASHDAPGEAWDVCAICGQVHEREHAVKVAHVLERGYFWVIPADEYIVEFRPFYGCHEPRYHGGFSTFEDAVECARNIFLGLTTDQPIAVWLYNPQPDVPVEQEQELPV